MAEVVRRERGHPGCGARLAIAVRSRFGCRVIEHSAVTVPVLARNELEHLLNSMVGGVTHRGRPVLVVAIRQRIRGSSMSRQVSRSSSPMRMPGHPRRAPSSGIGKVEAALRLLRARPSEARRSAAPREAFSPSTCRGRDSAFRPVGFSSSLFAGNLAESLEHVGSEPDEVCLPDEVEDDRRAIGEASVASSCVSSRCRS